MQQAERAHSATVTHESLDVTSFSPRTHPFEALPSEQPSAPNRRTALAIVAGAAAIMAVPAGAEPIAAKQELHSAFSEHALAERRHDEHAGWRAARTEMEAADAAWDEALQALDAAHRGYREPKRPKEFSPVLFGGDCALLRGAELRRHCESRVAGPIEGWKVDYVDQAVRRTEAWHEAREGARAALNLPALEAEVERAADRYSAAREAFLTTPAPSLSAIAEKLALVIGTDDPNFDLGLIERDVLAFAEREKSDRLRRAG